MSNNYIHSKDFYIRENLKSFLLYFDYFITPGLSLVKYSRNSLLRKVIYFLLRIFVAALYISQIYKLKYEIVPFNDNALVIFKGSGKWSNSIRLVESNGNLKIIKKVFNKKIFQKEKRFYNKYKNNKSKIKLPNCKFLNENRIEIEFLQLKSFRRLIIDGTFDIKDSMKHFEQFKKQFKLFYGNKSTLIHGDLWLTNIFMDNNNYYLIDYSDSFMSHPQYDLYVLLYSLLSTHNLINEEKKSIVNFSVNKILSQDLLGTNLQNMQRLENLFFTHREKRFS